MIESYAGISRTGEIRGSQYWVDDIDNIRDRNINSVYDKFIQEKSIEVIDLLIY